MEVKILQNESKLERIKIIKDNAEKSEELTYPKSLDEKQLTILKSDYTKEAIQLAKEEEVKKEFLSEFKAKVSPMKLKLNELMGMIRTKVEEVTETVYLIADHEDDMMGYYNEDGLLVSSRPLRPEERQFRIVDESIKKAN